MLLRFQGRHGFKKEHLIAFALLFNTFSWYFIGRLMIGRVGSVFVEMSFENLCLELTYSSSIIVSALIGSVLLTRVRKIRFFYAWLLFGVFASLCLTIPMGASLFAMIIAISILGASLGLGMPLCLSYFAESVPIENRGKVGGIILFATIFSAPLVSIIMANVDFSGAVLLAMWRAWSLPLLFLTSKKQIPPEPSFKKPPSLISVFQNKTFSLYFIAWLMFAFVDSFGSAAVDLQIGEFQFFVGIVEPFLREIQGARGITDFRVVCDETNNTAAVIDRNEFVASIFIKPARSINYVTLNFVAVRTGVDFEEVVGAASI